MGHHRSADALQLWEPTTGRFPNLCAMPCARDQIQHIDSTWYVWHIVFQEFDIRYGLQWDGAALREIRFLRGTPTGQQLKGRMGALLHNI